MYIVTSRFIHPDPSPPLRALISRGFPQYFAHLCGVQLDVGDAVISSYPLVGMRQRRVFCKSSRSMQRPSRGVTAAMSDSGLWHVKTWHSWHVKARRKLVRPAACVNARHSTGGCTAGPATWSTRQLCPASAPRMSVYSVQMSVSVWSRTRWYADFQLKQLQRLSYLQRTLHLSNNPRDCCLLEIAVFVCAATHTKMCGRAAPTYKDVSGTCRGCWGVHHVPAGRDFSLLQHQPSRLVSFMFPTSARACE